MPAVSPEHSDAATGTEDDDARNRPMLVLDAASGSCLVAVVNAAGVLAESRDAERGAATERLASLVAAALAAAGLTAKDLGGVAVTVGPGSFTGLRAALSLAHGIALGAGLALVAVTLAEALRASLPQCDGRPVWIAMDSRRGRVFLDRDGHVEPFAPEHLPSPAGPIAIAGDAAGLVAAQLSASGGDVLTCAHPLASASGIVAAALLRLAGRLPPLPALPLYVDPPEAKLPASGLRPAPV